MRKIKSKIAWIILGAIFSVIFLVTISLQIAARKSTSEPFFIKGGIWREQLALDCYKDDFVLSDYLPSPVKNSNNPIIPEGLSFRWIMKVDSTYYMYDELHDGNIWSIRMRTSADGYNWSEAGDALLNAGDEGEFDENGQADPTVIYDGKNDWKMWFDAEDGNNNWIALGYATSKDGLHWAKRGIALELGDEGAWDDDVIHHPVVIKHNGIYYMYYAGSASGWRFDIGLARSPDGGNWTKHGGNPVIRRGDSGCFDDKYIRPSKPVIIDDTWYMLYWANDGSGPYGKIGFLIQVLEKLGIQAVSGPYGRIGLATSPNGIVWTKRGLFMGIGPNGEWDDNGVTANSSLVEGDEIKVWFSGRNAATDGFATGLATIDIPTSSDPDNKWK